MTAEIIDAANELVQLRIDQAVARIRIDRNAVSATHCIECNEEIPARRRELVAGCLRCADCQEVQEILNKSWS